MNTIPYISYITSQSKFIIELGSSNFRYFNSSPINAADGNWHFVAFVVTGNGQTDMANSAMYADGQAEGIYDLVDSGLPTAKTAFYIGGDTNFHFSGLIDDVRVYNRALSAAEIQALYNAEH